jgi:uncharacterized protein YidB (DUF937 family)
MSGHRGGGIIGNLPTGVKLAAAALLLHQLMKHRQGGGAAPAGREETGGLGGILGGLLGRGEDDAAPRRREDDVAPRRGEHPAPRSAPAQGGGFLEGLLVGPVLGGLGGLLGTLRSQGLQSQADSSVAPGPNQPVSPRGLKQVFDRRVLDEAARRAGTDRATLLAELSRMLPEAVDRLTPQGRVPQREEELGGDGLGGILGRMLGSGDVPRR